MRAPIKVVSCTYDFSLVLSIMVCRPILWYMAMCSRFQRVPAKYVDLSFGLHRSPSLSRSGKHGAEWLKSWLQPMDDCGIFVLTMLDAIHLLTHWLAWNGLSFLQTDAGPTSKSSIKHATCICREQPICRLCQLIMRLPNTPFCTSASSKVQNGSFSPIFKLTLPRFSMF